MSGGRSPVERSSDRQQERIRCRFCSYSRLRIRRGKDGKVIFGADGVLLHVRRCHTKRWAQIEKWAARACSVAPRDSG